MHPGNHAPIRARLRSGLAPRRQAQVAQLVEHATENRSVAGSIPALGTICLMHFIPVDLHLLRSSPSRSRLVIAQSDVKLALTGTAGGAGVGNRSLGYRPELDGLRAVAVASVLLYHLGSPISPGGFVGVDVFFVLSGFLITRLIAEELRIGEFSLLKFYERRIRRIVARVFCRLRLLHGRGCNRPAPSRIETLLIEPDCRCLVRQQLLVPSSFRLLLSGRRNTTAVAHMEFGGRGAVLHFVSDNARSCIQTWPEAGRGRSFGPYLPFR